MSIGIGIIGSGGISHAHAEAYRQLSEDAHLVAVADIDAQRAREAASNWAVLATVPPPSPPAPSGLGPPGEGLYSRAATL